MSAVRSGAWIPLALLAGSAGAQPGDSFRELAELIELGKDVVVTHGPEEEVVIGKALDISGSSLSVLVSGRRVELDESRVLRIRQHWEDPTRDGFAIGFAVGAAPLLVMFVLMVHHEGELPSGGAAGLAGLGLLTGAIGTAGGLIGASIDGRHTGMTDLYRASNGKRRGVLRPLMSREHAGAALSVSW